MNQRLVACSRTFVRVACTAYILMYFSEFLAWARLRPQDTPMALWNTFVVYCILAVVLLSLAHRMRASGFWAVYLCGAVVGWICEGVMVQTLYMALPVTIIWSGLAWHALITVAVGWHRISTSLHSRSTGHSALLLSSCGLIYGVWAASWWAEQGGYRQPPMTFAIYSLVTGWLAVLAYWVNSNTFHHPFILSRGAQVILGVTLAVYAISTIRAIPYAPLVLGPLSVITLWALKRMAGDRVWYSSVQKPTTRIPLLRAMVILALPVMAIITYSLLYTLDAVWRTHGLMYVVTIPLATVLYAMSLWKAFRMSPQRPAEG